MAMLRILALTDKKLRKAVEAHIKVVKDKFNNYFFSPASPTCLLVANNNAFGLTEGSWETSPALTFVR